MSNSSSKQTQWMHDHDLVRPGLYLPREDWERFEQAVAYENYLRAQDGFAPVSRTNVVEEFIRKWSAGKLQDDLHTADLSDGVEDDYGEIL